jgi:outer membrane protein assembly factor BamA
LLSSFQLLAQEYKVTVKSKANLPKEFKSIYNFTGDSAAIQDQLKIFLQNLYRDGYLAASIDSLRYDSANVVVNLFIGKKYSWAELDFSQLDETLQEELKGKKRKTETVDLIELQNLKKQIVSFYENSGYPFVSVKLEAFEMDDSVFRAVIVAVKGDFYSIDSLIVKGDAKISTNYLKKALQIESGEPFNQKKINAISKRMNDLKFLSEIKPAEIEFREESIDLYLYLQNKKANMFNGIIGFLPDPDNHRDEKTGKLLITGELNLNLVNSFGRGEEIFLNWEKLESSTQKLNVGFMYPYFFKSNLGLDADFGLYKKDSTFLSLNAGFGIRLFLSFDDYIKAYYRYKSSSRIGDEKAMSLSLNYADVKSNIFGASYYLNELDYKLNPRKGVELNLYGGVGFKNIDHDTNGNDSLNTDNSTIELEAGLNLDVYFPIYRNFVFHFGNTTRFLDQFADHNQEVVFYENELYRFGGARSLRGFDESIFYASIYSLQNVEIKYLFEQNSSFYVFWNGAYYYKNVVNDITEDFPWGLGIGIDFDTRAGIFSLSYAIGKQFDNPLEIRTAKIHFGYISRF